MTTETYDWPAIVEGLNRYLRLRSIPIGMKLFETVEAMEAIPKIRRPKVRHTTDQIVAQARQLGWTVGITMADLIGAQCGAVIGLHPQDDEWLSGTRMAGVWFKTREDASAHQHAMDCVPHGRYRAMAVAPLTSGRLNPPDICLIYGTPGQMIFFINGLQWSGYKKMSFTSVGESACADSWGKALKTGEPALTIPCYAERRYGGVADDELLMAIPPRFLPKVIEGLAALDKNGLRYPIPCRRRSRRLLRRQGDEQESVVAGTALARYRGRRWTMPEKRTLERAQRDRREGKSPTTQAGEFVREEIHHVREGKHGARSAKQAIAIGLSKARRAGVKLPPPKKGSTSARTRRSAISAYRAGQHGKRKTSARRARATERALKREPRRAASRTALSRQAKMSAQRRKSPARRAA